MEDDIGIGRRLPQNVLRSIPRVPLCNEAKEERRASEADRTYLR
jgi:hypothetical protein